jgi:hypothetical protein
VIKKVTASPSTSFPFNVMFIDEETLVSIEAVMLSTVGASLIGFIVAEIVAILLSSNQSFALNVKVSVPL